MQDIQNISMTVKILGLEKAIEESIEMQSFNERAY